MTVDLNFIRTNNLRVEDKLKDNSKASVMCFWEGGSVGKSAVQARGTEFDPRSHCRNKELVEHRSFLASQSNLTSELQANSEPALKDKTNNKTKVDSARGTLLLASLCTCVYVNAQIHKHTLTHLHTHTSHVAKVLAHSIDQKQAQNCPRSKVKGLGKDIITRRG